MFSSNDKISIRQLQVLLILDIFGMGITILPGRMADFASQDGWACVILGTIGACICTWIMASLAEMFPNDSFISYTGKIVSKPIGIIISAGFILKIILSLSMEVRVFSEIMNQTILFSTPTQVISACILLLGAYGASKGYETRGRIAEILIFIIFIPLILVFCFVATDIDYTNLLPIMKTDGTKIIEGSIFSIFTFSGAEFIMLAYPYLSNKAKAKKGSVKAIALVGTTMMIITIITLAKFGPFDIKNQMWPVLEIMDTIDFPGAFIERQDALVMSFWIMSLFIIINAGVFFSSLLAKDIIKKGKRIHYIYIIIPIIYLISLIPNSISSVYSLINKFYITFGAAYILIIPVILLAVAKIRKLGEKNAEKN